MTTEKIKNITNNSATFNVFEELQIQFLNRMILPFYLR